MEQHSVPQHIASFEFKLFGNLTVRQFITLAIPGSIATLIFFSNLPNLVKFPLVFIFAAIGLAAALVPFQGRPLDKWLVAFIKSILSPTQRIWVKEPNLPDFLTVITKPPTQETTIPETLTSQGRERLSQYLKSLPREKLLPIDVKEQIALQRLDFDQSQNLGGFSDQLPSPIIWPTQQPPGQKPSYLQTSSLPQVQTVTPTTPPPFNEEEYPKAFKEALPAIRTTTAPKISPHAKPYALPGLEKKLSQKTQEPVHTQLISEVEASLATLVKKPQAHLASEMNFSIENIIPIHTPNKQIRLLPQVGKTRVRKLHFAPPEGFDLSKLPIRGEKRFEISEELKKQFNFEDIQLATSFPIPESPPTNAPQTILVPKATKKTSHSIPKATKNLERSPDISLKIPEEEYPDSKIAITDKRAAPPSLGTAQKAKMAPLTDNPNVISGLVTNFYDSPVEGAICIVIDQNGIPQRAIKTNKLGQFLSVTPLPNGKYTLAIESELASFKPITVNINGDVVAPLEIKAEEKPTTN